MPQSLEEIRVSAKVPGVSSAHVELGAKKAAETQVLAAGRKSVVSSKDDVDKNTIFPASSLSKIVFTYLVLELAEKGFIDIAQTKLHDIFPYEPFEIDGVYPEKAKQLTAEHVLSHTTGLPNYGSAKLDKLKFSDKEKLGEGFSYSGYAIHYLQRVIEEHMKKQTGEIHSLESLARKYVFAPLGMKDTTFLTSKVDQSRLVQVHTDLGYPSPIFKEDQPADAAGSLLTTASDFSKFMAAWLKKMDDPLVKKSMGVGADPEKHCGLGWHIYRENGQHIVYQYGQNLGTQSFVALNVHTRKAAVFFTNSDHGMSIADKLFKTDGLMPIGDLRTVYKEKGYLQSDLPGWKDTLAGRHAEKAAIEAELMAQQCLRLGKDGEAKVYFEKAAHKNAEARTYYVRAKIDVEKHRPKEGDSIEVQKDYEVTLKAIEQRLKWFDAVEKHKHGKEQAHVPKKLVGVYTTEFGDKVELIIKNKQLLYKEFGKEIPLTLIGINQSGERQYVPTSDQSFIVNIDRAGNMKMQALEFLHYPAKAFTLQPDKPTAKKDVSRTTGGKLPTKKTAGGEPPSLSGDKMKTQVRALQKTAKDPEITGPKPRSKL